MTTGQKYADWIALQRMIDYARDEAARTKLTALERLLKMASAQIAQDIEDLSDERMAAAARRKASTG